MRLPPAAESTTQNNCNVNFDNNGDPTVKNANNDTQLNANVREVDYSEYEWMEHIEEFDKQVIRELEEQAFYEECFIEAAEVSEGIIDCYCCDSDDLGECDDEDEGFYVVVSARPNPQIFSSPLNPTAPEFVPKSFFEDNGGSDA